MFINEECFWVDGDMMGEYDQILMQVSPEERLEAERQMLLYGNAFFEVTIRDDVKLYRLIRKEDLKIVSRRK